MKSSSFLIAKPDVLSGVKTTGSGRRNTVTNTNQVIELVNTSSCLMNLVRPPAGQLLRPVQFRCPVQNDSNGSGCLTLIRGKDEKPLGISRWLIFGIFR